MDFSDMDENKALRIEQTDLNEPTLAEAYHNELYYLDQEFVTSVASTGGEEATFRYDLENDSVVWKNTDLNSNSTATQLHNGIFYVTEGLNKDHAAVSYLSIEDGSVIETYENENFEMTRHIQLFDEHLLMLARTQGGDTDDLHLLAFSLSSGEFLWAEPVFAIEQAVEIDEAFIYRMSESASDENEGFAAFDKETGEQLFKIKGKTNTNKPVVNSSHIYLFDYTESVISVYDFQGELAATYESPVSFNFAQQVLQAATDDFIVYADEEALIWMEPDLSGEINRIETGEAELDRLFSTEDFLYAITKEDDGDTEMYYVVIIDKVSAEIQGKLPLDHPFHYGEHPVHVYDEKFHVSIHSNEEDLQRVHYLFSGFKEEYVHLKYLI